MDDPIHDAAPQAAGMQVKRIREAAPQRRLEIALNTVLISQEIHQSENASYSPKFPTIIPSSSSGVRIFAAFGLAFSSRWFSGASAPLSAIAAMPCAAVWNVNRFAIDQACPKETQDERDRRCRFLTVICEDLARGAKFTACRQRGLGLRNEEDRDMNSTGMGGRFLRRAGWDFPAPVVNRSECCRTAGTRSRCVLGNGGAE